MTLRGVCCFSSAFVSYSVFKDVNHKTAHLGFMFGKTCFGTLKQVTLSMMRKVHLHAREVGLTC